MNDEERQRQMDFILNQQAQFAANMQTLQAADARALHRIDRLERVLKLAITAGQRERRESREKFNALIDAQARMADAQTHTERRLEALLQGRGEDSNDAERR